MMYVRARTMQRVCILLLLASSSLVRVLFRWVINGTSFSRVTSQESQFAVQALDPHQFRLQNTIMRNILTSKFFLAVLAVLGSLGEAQKSACSEPFTCFNGNDVEAVTTDEACKVACQACEGGDWRCPDLRISEHVDTLTNQTVRYYECQCGFQDCGGGEWRQACIDPEFSSGSFGSTVVGAVVTILTVTIAGVFCFL